MGWLEEALSDLDRRANYRDGSWGDGNKMPVFQELRKTAIERQELGIHQKPRSRYVTSGAKGAAVRSVPFRVPKG